MENNFEYVMSKQTDIGLFKILTGPQTDYKPEALEAARNEFAKRNLSADQFETLKQEIEEEEEIKNEKANVPLDLSWKVLTFIFPGMINLMFHGMFKTQGYTRKASELVSWTLYGAGFYAALIILLSRF
jgi:hypothetical protein